MKRILNQTYEIGQEIGKGGMSHVYSATHVRLGTVWAVKEISKSLELQLDITQEAEILKNLSHQNLVRIVDILEDENSVYVVEDFVDGKTLETIIAEGNISEETMISYFKTLCGVLIYLHNQKPNPVIYRDMKPANIMIENDGTLKLIDFGIARVYKNQSAGDTVAAGTTGYAAPEQFGKTQSDARTDIYSLGMTMFHLATGKSPYEPPYGVTSAKQLNPKISAGLDHIIAKCIRPEPIDRYQTAEELLDDLNHIEKYDEQYIAVRRKKTGIRAAIALLYLSGILCLGGSYVLHSKQVEKQYFELIASAINSADENERADYFRQAEKLLPNREEAYFEELKKYYELQNYEALLSRKEELDNLGVIDNKTMPHVTALLGSAYQSMGEYEKANKEFLQLKEDGFDFPVDSSVDYATVLIHLGDKENAQAIINSLEGRISDYQLSYLNGQINYLSGDYKQAVAVFSDLISQNEDSEISSRAYISLAEVYRDIAKLDKNDPNYLENASELALSVINQAQTKPDLMNNSVLWEMKGMVFYNIATQGEDENKIEHLNAAISSFENVLKLGIQKIYLYQNIFACCMQIPDYTHAQETLDQMKAAFPDDYLPHALNSQLIIVAENEKEQSLRNYDRAIEEYELAKQKGESAQNKEQLQQLEGLIEQLRTANWVD